ncbi:tripartite tricarboxylate transporter substrate binding protein [Bosea sp. F3-2]|uniref:Bug family tripartite tricarboxylate transporter substrate binding protein n=1 Tax=Bosea sp. F3-2 TaxID=2599640 RepID=UPI0020BF49DE|nr:tripartite tricarboxylate transporter substrate binding protein [Bosea sp. F3-2]
MLATAALGIGGLASSMPVAAQSYPTKPITFIVPFPPGGTSDTMGRLVAQELGKSLGHTVVVENRAGANGNIGSAAAARAAPDGYTLILSGVGSHAINAGIYKNLLADPITDFTHITLIASGANAIAVNSAFPAKTLKELIDLAKKEPGKYNYASSGVGSSGHMAMELFKMKAGVKIDHIPYRGGAPAMTDVMGGQVPILITNADAILPHVKTGKLRILAVTSAERNAMYPDTPTIAESGFPDVVAVSWTGISAPAKLPAEIVARLQQETAKAVKGPIEKRLEAVGLVSGGISSADFNKFVAGEVAKWKAVAESAGITAE